MLLLLLLLHLPLSSNRPWVAQTTSIAEPMETKEVSWWAIFWFFFSFGKLKTLSLRLVTRRAAPPLWTRSCSTTFTIFVHHSWSRQWGRWCCWRCWSVRMWRMRRMSWNRCVLTLGGKRRMSTPGISWQGSMSSCCGLQRCGRRCGPARGQVSRGCRRIGMIATCVRNEAAFSWLTVVYCRTRLFGERLGIKIGRTTVRGSRWFARMGTPRRRHRPGEHSKYNVYWLHSFLYYAGVALLTLGRFACAAGTASVSAVVA